MPRYVIGVGYVEDEQEAAARTTPRGSSGLSAGWLTRPLSPRALVESGTEEARRSLEAQMAAPRLWERYVDPLLRAPSAWLGERLDYLRTGDPIEPVWPKLTQPGGEPTMAGRDVVQPFIGGREDFDLVDLILSPYHYPRIAVEGAIRSGRRLLQGDVRGFGSELVETLGREVDFAHGQLAFTAGLATDLALDPVMWALPFEYAGRIGADAALRSLPRAVTNVGRLAEEIGGREARSAFQTALQERLGTVIREVGPEAIARNQPGAVARVSAAVRDTGREILPGLNTEAERILQAETFNALQHEWGSAWYYRLGREGGPLDIRVSGRRFSPVAESIGEDPVLRTAARARLGDVTGTRYNVHMLAERSDWLAKHPGEMPTLEDITAMQQRAWRASEAHRGVERPNAAWVPSSPHAQQDLLALELDTWGVTRPVAAARSAPDWATAPRFTPGGLPVDDIAGLRMRPGNIPVGGMTAPVDRPAYSQIAEDVGMRLEETRLWLSRGFRGQTPQQQAEAMISSRIPSAAQREVARAERDLRGPAWQRLQQWAQGTAAPTPGVAATRPYTNALIEARRVAIAGQLANERAVLRDTEEAIRRLTGPGLRAAMDEIAEAHMQATQPAVSAQQAEPDLVQAENFLAFLRSVQGTATMQEVAEYGRQPGNEWVTGAMQQAQKAGFVVVDDAGNVTATGRRAQLASEAQEAEARERRERELRRFTETSGGKSVPLRDFEMEFPGGRVVAERLGYRVIAGATQRGHVLVPSTPGEQSAARMRWPGEYDAALRVDELKWITDARAATVADAAEVLGVSEEYVERLLRSQIARDLGFWTEETGDPSRSPQTAIRQSIDPVRWPTAEQAARQMGLFDERPPAPRLPAPQQAPAPELKYAEYAENGDVFLYHGTTADRLYYIRRYGIYGDPAYGPALTTRPQTAGTFAQQRREMTGDVETVVLRVRVPASEIGNLRPNVDPTSVAYAGLVIPPEWIVATGKAWEFEQDAAPTEGPAVASPPEAPPAEAPQAPQRNLQEIYDQYLAEHGYHDLKAQAAALMAEIEAEIDTLKPIEELKDLGQVRRAERRGHAFFRTPWGTWRFAKARQPTEEQLARWERVAAEASALEDQAMEVHRAAMALLVATKASTEEAAPSPQPPPVALQSPVSAPEAPSGAQAPERPAQPPAAPQRPAPPEAEPSAREAMQARPAQPQAPAPAATPERDRPLAAAAAQAASELPVLKRQRADSLERIAALEAMDRSYVAAANGRADALADLVAQGAVAEKEEALRDFIKRQRRAASAFSYFPNWAPAHAAAMGTAWDRYGDAVERITGPMHGLFGEFNKEEQLFIGWMMGAHMHTLRQDLALATGVTIPAGTEVEPNEADVLRAYYDFGNIEPTPEMLAAGPEGLQTHFPRGWEMWQAGQRGLDFMRMLYTGLKPDGTRAHSYRSLAEMSDRLEQMTGTTTYGVSYLDFYWPKPRIIRDIPAHAKLMYDTLVSAGFNEEKAREMIENVEDLRAQEDITFRATFESNAFRYAELAARIEASGGIMQADDMVLFATLDPVIATQWYARKAARVGLTHDIVEFVTTEFPTRDQVIADVGEEGLATLYAAGYRPLTIVGEPMEGMEEYLLPPNYANVLEAMLVSQLGPQETLWPIVQTMMNAARRVLRPMQAAILQTRFFVHAQIAEYVFRILLQFGTAFFSPRHAQALNAASRVLARDLMEQVSLVPPRPVNVARTGIASLVLGGTAYGLGTMVHPALGPVAGATVAGLTALSPFAMRMRLATSRATEAMAGHLIKTGTMSEEQIIQYYEEAVRQTIVTSGFGTQSVEEIANLGLGIPASWEDVGRHVAHTTGMKAEATRTAASIGHQMGLAQQEIRELGEATAELFFGIDNLHRLTAYIMYRQEEYTEEEAARKVREMTATYSAGAGSPLLNFLKSWMWFSTFMIQTGNLLQKEARRRPGVALVLAEIHRRRNEFMDFDAEYGYILGGRSPWMLMSPEWYPVRWSNQLFGEEGITVGPLILKHKGPPVAFARLRIVPIEEFGVWADLPINPGRWAADKLLPTLGLPMKLADSYGKAEAGREIPLTARFWSKADRVPGMPWDLSSPYAQVAAGRQVSDDELRRYIEPGLAAEAAQQGNEYWKAFSRKRLVPAKCQANMKLWKENPDEAAELELQLMRLYYDVELAANISGVSIRIDWQREMLQNMNLAELVFAQAEADAKLERGELPWIAPRGDYRYTYQAEIDQRTAEKPVGPVTWLDQVGAVSSRLGHHLPGGWERQPLEQPMTVGGEGER